MHQRWVRNPKAPSSLWDGLVLDGAYAGLHPGTNRFVDGSGLENHGTLRNMDAATDWVWSDELGRWALDFDGSNDNVIHANAPTLNFGTVNFAICAWVKSASLANAFPRIVSKQSSTTNGFSFYTRLTDGFLRFNRAGTYVSPSGLGSVLTGNWLFVAASLEAGNVVFVRDSQSEIVAIGAASVSTAEPLVQGSGFDKSNTWKGRMSDLRLFSRSLSLSESSWLANPANHLYVPDTRRHFWFPMSRPWLYARTSSVIIGGGIA